MHACFCVYMTVHVYTELVHTCTHKYIVKAETRPDVNPHNALEVWLHPCPRQVLHPLAERGEVSFVHLEEEGERSG